MRNLTVLVLLFIATAFLSETAAQESSRRVEAKLLSGGAQISLLTCSPSDSDIYTLFGHTALRVKDDSIGVDVAFNYGLFDFGASQARFVYRFVKGETYYKVDGISTKYFLFDYQYNERGIREQVLNLTENEKQSVWAALIDNIQPENQVYLYNFLYNNCSTKARDVIFDNIGRKVQYEESAEVLTYRDLLRECTNVDPWGRFGIDIIIGNDADKPITSWQKDFIPAYLEKSFRSATFEDGTPLVIHENDLLETQLDLTPKGAIDAPFLVGCFVLMITLVITLLNIKGRWQIGGRIFDTLLFSVAGIGGCIIFFLMYLSIHPSMTPNWNLVWLNPLQLVVVFLFFVKPAQKWICYYHFINFVLLLLFLLAWCLIPQQLSIAFVPYIITLCVRSGANVITRKVKK